MHVLLALLCVCAVAAPEAAGLPMTQGSIKKYTTHIEIIASTTLVHIRKLKAKLPAAPQINVSAPPVNGLTGVSHHLGLLDSELKNLSTERLVQIQADVSSLNGFVHYLVKTMDCPVQKQSAGQICNDSFLETCFHKILAKVEVYLKNMILNKGKLRVC